MLLGLGACCLLLLFRTKTPVRMKRMTKEPDFGQNWKKCQQNSKKQTFDMKNWKVMNPL